MEAIITAPRTDKFFAAILSRPSKSNFAEKFSSAGVIKSLIAAFSGS
jgi:hypothetical protein